MASNAYRRRKKLDDAIDRLAGLFPYGHLLASTDPAQLFIEASEEIERLRAAQRDGKDGEKR